MIPFSAPKKKQKNLAHAHLVLALRFCCCAHVIANKLFHTLWQTRIVNVVRPCRIYGCRTWVRKEKKKTQGPCRIGKLDIWMSHLSKKKKKTQDSWMQLSLHKMVIQCLYNYMLSLLLPCYSIFTVFEDFNLLLYLLLHK